MQVGVHVIMNVYDVTNTALLTSLECGKPISDHIVDTLQLHVLERAGHQFQPHGYTLMYLLSESHYSIHTYPEFQSCYLDIFCCNKEFDPVVAVALVRDAFGTDNVQYHVIAR